MKRTVRYDQEGVWFVWKDGHMERHPVPDRFRDLAYLVRRDVWAHIPVTDEIAKEQAVVTASTFRRCEFHVPEEKGVFRGIHIYLEAGIKQ